ncbi:MAG: EAL domain-containing protein [Nitrospirae bacterium]|nr:EAL domain-containing protein [Nitrospirota bacterium]
MFDYRQFKMFVIVGTSLSALFIVLLIASRLILLDSFVEIEHNNMEKNVERTLNALNGELAHLSTVNGDYAGWDESYKFINDGNKAFLKDNLPDAVFPQLHLNILVYIRNSGEVVYKRGFDLIREIPVPVSESFLKHLTPESPLVRHPRIESTIKGIMRLPEGILLVSSRPVLTNEFKGPIRGALIIGRYLDSKEIEQIAQQTKLSINVIRVDDKIIPDDIKIAIQKIDDAAPVLVSPLSRDLVAGYATVKDIYGNNAFVTKVESQRKIYRQGVDTITYFILWFVLAVLVFALINNRLFKKLVLSRRMGKESEAKYRAVIEQANEGIIIVNCADKMILEGNTAFKSLLGYNSDEILKMSLYDIVSEDIETSSLEIERIDKEKRDLRLRHKDGSVVYAELSASNLSQCDSNTMCVVVHDITDRKLFEEQLMDQATHDSLTGLANKNLLNDRLGQATAYQKRKKMLYAVMLLDIDRFKVINDTLGHSSGDILLKQIAERLANSVRNYDTVARLGGDEFVILVNDVTDTNDIITVAKNILDLFTASVKINENELFVAASIGISMFPSDGETADHLLMKADTAMYHCKAQGGNNYQFFAEEMNVRVKNRLSMETNLRKALEQQEFVLYYQPKIDLSTGEICGMEALIRWQKDGYMISPAEFIYIAEETGIILPIGEWVLRTSCRDMKKLIDDGFSNLVMSSNLSSRQFANENLIELIGSALDENCLDPVYVELELTESILMKNEEKLVRKLFAIKDRGIRLSIDDFGTGYSSLSYLKKFPIDVLKIDRSFVMDITTNPDGASIVETILAMTHTLKLRSVAEGVEKLEELLFLAGHGCEEMQGYYFSRPVPFDSFREMLRSGKKLEVSTIVS